MPERETAVTAITASAELGGTERVLLDVATRAFEFGVTLRILTPRDGPLVARCRRLGIPTDVAAMPPGLLRGSQRAGHLHTIPRAVAALGRWKRDLVAHTWVAEADVIYAVGFKPYLGTRGLDRPVIWHLHEMPPKTTGWYWRRLARRAPVAVIASSGAVRDAWNVPHAVTIPNGVDLDVFTPRGRTGWIHDLLGIDPKDRLIGMPAVLAEWKGHLQVLDAFQDVADEFPDVHLVFVGGSIYDTVAERSFEHRLRAELGARVHLVPFQEHIERVYPEFDVCVHYSLRPEPFGRVIVEAMACGVPVLAAAEGGPREIVTAGGWLVPPRDPEALAARLTDAFSMPRDALADIGRWGRIRAEDAYSAREFAQRVCVVLRSVSR